MVDALLSTLHPRVVHFPIALLFLGVLLDLTGFLAERKELNQMGLLLLLLGTLGAVAAVLSGNWAEEVAEKALSGSGKELLETHEERGKVVLGAFVALSIFRFFLARRPIRSLMGTYLFLALIGLGTLTLQARDGGRLVYDYGAGVQVPASDPQPSGPADEPQIADPKTGNP